MFNFFKKEKKPIYKIAFCEENDLSTKFGEDNEVFNSYEEAKYRIFSTVAGYGKAIDYYEGDSAKLDSLIDNAWLIIEKRG